MSWINIVCVHSALIWSISFHQPKHLDSPWPSLCSHQSLKHAIMNENIYLESIIVHLILDPYSFKHILHLAISEEEHSVGLEIEQVLIFHLCKQGTYFFAKLNSR